MRVAARLLPFAPLGILLACDPGSRELPSAPSPGITAHRSTSERPSAPSPRGYLLLVHDPVKDRLYLPGGLSTICLDIICANAAINDLWSFNPRSRTWSEVANVLPSGEGDAAALDYRSRQIIMFQPFSDPIGTWAYDIDRGTWENRHPAVEPPARWGSMMVYDPKADRALLYGGADLFTGDVLGDLWAYDYETNTWTELHPSVSPPPHHFTALVYVPTTDRVILFGGYQPGFTTLFNDTWAYDYSHNRWKNLKPANPPAPRVYHYMAFEPRTNSLVMFGGILQPSDLPDETTINETWTYSVAKNRWTRVFPEGTPSARAWHVMSGTNGPAVLFGGGPSRLAYTNETYLYDSRANQWVQVLGADDAVRGRAAVRPVASGRAGATGALGLGGYRIRR